MTQLLRHVSSRNGNLLDDTKGAVMAEFAIVITPLLMLFFSLLQMAFLYTAQLLVKHAAWIAAREAAVSYRANPPEANCLKGSEISGDANAESAADLRYAVEVALRPWMQPTGLYALHLGPKSINPTLNGTGPDKTTDPQQTITIDLAVYFDCWVPIGNTIVCGSDQKTVVNAEAIEPIHYAAYLCT